MLLAIIKLIVSNNLKSILIWDAPNPPLDEKKMVILWRDLLWGGAPNNYISIPALVEKNCLVLRGQYLAWIYDLGIYECYEGKTVIDYLTIENGLSFWWMTELSEKCNHSKSLHIDDALYLRAFENWAFPKDTEKIVLVSSNQNLSVCIKQWCNKRNIIFELIEPTKTSRLKFNIFKLIPYWLNGVISLVHYLWVRWSLRGLGLIEWASSKNKITLISYFLNMNLTSLDQGILESKYWGSLPNFLNKSNKFINWLHFYEKSDEIPTIRDLKKKIRLLNLNGSGQNIHVVAESFISIQIVLKTIKEWLLIRKKCQNIEKIFSKVYFGGFDLEPLYLSDWRKYCYGSGSLYAILKLNLMNQAFLILQRQDYGIFLQENQNWEFGFIRAWKNNNHQKLIGFPHSTVRFWDLRYFMDRRVYDGQESFKLPLPDLVGINGSHALNLFSEAEFPRERIVKVESLRFLYLNRDVINPAKYSKLFNEEISILVIPDIVNEQAFLQIKLLEKAIKLLNRKVRILLKPHPGSQFIANQFPDLSIVITKQPIADLLNECDIAYVGNMTTASLEAFIFGVPLLIFYDPKSPNYSPMRGQKDISFAIKPEDIIKAVNLYKNPAINTINSDNYFYLDPDLKFWKSQLNIPL